MCNGIKIVWLRSEKHTQSQSKSDQKTAISDFFFDFLETVDTIRTKIICSHSTPQKAPACAMAIQSYGLDLKNMAKISPKLIKNCSFLDFFRFSQKLITIHMPQRTSKFLLIRFTADENELLS